jgi:hypothetical protein
METSDERRFRIFGAHCARVHWHLERAVRKGRLVDSVGHALHGSNSCKGSRILEGTRAADRRNRNAARDGQRARPLLAQRTCTDKVG